MPVQTLPVNQYYNQGVNVALAGVQGSELRTEDMRQQELLRQQQMANDLQQRKQDGAQALAQSDQDAYANGGSGVVPGGGLPWQQGGAAPQDPSAAPAGGAAPQDPNAPPSGGLGGAGAAPDYSMNGLSGRLRQRAAYYRSIGDGVNADKAESDAYMADIREVNQHGMAAAQDPEALGHVAQWINSQVPGMSMTPGKDGYMMVNLQGEDGKPQTLNLNKVQTARMLGGIAVYAKDPEMGLKIIGAVNADLAAAVDTHNKAVTTVATERNKALTDSQNSDARMQAANARMESAYAAQERAGLMAQRAQMGARGAPVQMVDAKTGDARMFSRGQDGSWQEEALPPGMRLPRQAVDSKQVEALAQNLIGTPMPGTGPDGKPQKYTADTAYQRAYDVIQSTMGGGRPSGGFQVPANVDPAAAAAAAKGGGAPAGGLKVPANSPPEKFLRTPNTGRGGPWSYTASPRGLTMDDYKALDAARGK